MIQSSNSALSAFLQDARRFVLRFRHILETAPLQIYSSALIFAPKASKTRKAFVNEMPGWIKALSKREDDWDACRSVLEGHTSSVNAVAFSPDGHYLHTNRGDIPLPSPSAPSPSSQTKRSSNVFIQDEWISLDQQAILVV